MLSKQDFERDNRFYINSITLDEILKRCKIKKYELCTVRIGKLRHDYKKLMAIYETIPYRFLINPTDESLIKEYMDYCDIPSAKKDNPDRSIDCYSKLMKKFENDVYDIRKGVIVINQFNCIQEGLHRSCILYKKYGAQHKIQVLRIYTEKKYWGIKQYLKMMLFNIKNFL